jgi:hypothetical protein
MSEEHNAYIVRELNDRATAYCRSGMSIEAAIKQSVTDYAGQLKGVGYKILSEEEVNRHNENKFFEALRRATPAPDEGG